MVDCKIDSMLKSKGITKRSLAAHLGINETVINRTIKNPRITLQTLTKIAKFLDCDVEELLNNGSNGVHIYDHDEAPRNKRLIPLYDDISTIGGNLQSGYSAKMNSDRMQPAEWIDPGDWFKNATCAVRHYEDSMIEYPSGCILALKEVIDRTLIVPGKIYVIETSEYRITKKVQFADEHGKIIRAHSTNVERYDDGTLIHQPFNICLEKQVLRLFEVLGYVVKTSGGTLVYANK